jgi:hypothetical protein
MKVPKQQGKCFCNVPSIQYLATNCIYKFLKTCNLKKKITVMFSSLHNDGKKFTVTDTNNLSVSSAYNMNSTNICTKSKMKQLPTRRKTMKTDGMFWTVTLETLELLLSH